MVHEDDVPDQNRRRQHISLILTVIDNPSWNMRGNISVLWQDNQRLASCSREDVPHSLGTLKYFLNHL